MQWKSDDWSGGLRDFNSVKSVHLEISGCSSRGAWSHKSKEQKCHHVPECFLQTQRTWKTDNSLLMYMRASVIQSMKRWSIHSEIRDGLCSNCTGRAAVREAALSGRFCGFIDFGACNHPPSDVAGWGRTTEPLRSSVAQLQDSSAKVETVHRESQFKGLHPQRTSGYYCLLPYKKKVLLNAVRGRWKLLMKPRFVQLASLKFQIRRTSQKSQGSWNLRRNL